VERSNRIGHACKIVRVQASRVLTERAQTSMAQLAVQRVTSYRTHCDAAIGLVAKDRRNSARGETSR